jgi:mandelate racemase
MRPLARAITSATAVRLARRETAHWLEWQDWADPILAEPFALDEGTLVVSARPGAGIEWNEDAVKRFRYDA